MADIGELFIGMVNRLPEQERELFRGLITPEFTSKMHQVNPTLAASLAQVSPAEPATMAAPTQPVQPAQPTTQPQPQAPASAHPMQQPQNANIAANMQPMPEQKTNFADGGVIQRGQSPNDPVAPTGVPVGQADDLQRNVSDGEFVVPADVVDKKGTEFFDKLVQSTRQAEQKRREEQAAAEAAKQGPVQQPMNVPPAPPSNEQPTSTGAPVQMPQGTGATQRKPIL